MRTNAHAMFQMAGGAGAEAERQHLIVNIEQFLRDALSQLQPDNSPREVGRPRILPALCLWGGLLVCVLNGFTSQLELWRLLTLHGLWDFPRFPLSDQAIYKRLAADSTPLERLFEQISALLRARLTPFALRDLAPWASEVFVLDETTLDPVARRLPALREAPAGAILPGKLAGLFDVRRQQWRRMRYLADPRQNEKVAASALVADLPSGSLLLADLGYFAFAWFDALTDARQWWLSRLRHKTSYEIRHVFYQDADLLDALVWLGAYRADRAAHAVRLITLRLGARTYSYITNVLEPRQLPPRDIVRLYARRWDIELAINLVKTHLKLHLWWSAKPEVILHQIWAVLIIAQILQALRLEIAGRAAVDPDEVSMALLVRHLPRIARAGHDPIAFFVANGRFAGFIRPSTRIQRQAPEEPPDQVAPLPPDLELTRTPRYPHRKCGRGQARK